MNDIQVIKRICELRENISTAENVRHCPQRLKASIRGAENIGRCVYEHLDAEASYI